MAYKVQMGGRELHGLCGNLHMHTTASDGTATHQELASIASAAGLDFIVITDHNVYRPGLDGWVGGVLVLVGEEVHDPSREPQSSHTLCLNISEDVARFASDPQKLVDAVAAQGGLTFLAHPYERDVADFLPEPNISWRDWHVTGFTGIELWNYMSEFKSVLVNRARAILYAYMPALAVLGPYPETLSKWDGLLLSRPVPAFGGSDAHGTEYTMGPLSRAVQPYDYLFRCVNTHLLSEHPLSGQLEHDKELVYAALQSGRSFVANEQLGSAEGFSFRARSGETRAIMGEQLVIRNCVELRVTVPRRATLRILRNGRIIVQGRGEVLALMTPHPGAYRVEAYRRAAGRLRGWIFSNPIYVRG